MSIRLQDETESRQKMSDKLSHERHQNQREKENTQEVGLGSLYTQQTGLCVQTVTKQDTTRHHFHVSDYSVHRVCTSLESHKFMFAKLRPYFF